MSSNTWNQDLGAKMLRKILHCAIDRVERQVCRWLGRLLTSCIAETFSSVPAVPFVCRCPARFSVGCRGFGRCIFWEVVHNKVIEQRIWNVMESLYCKLEFQKFLILFFNAQINSLRWCSSSFRDSPCRWRPWKYVKRQPRLNKILEKTRNTHEELVLQTCDVASFSSF